MTLLLNQRQAATVLGRSVRTVRRWTRLGVLPTFVDPDTGFVYYPRPALERWAANAGLSAPTTTGDLS